MNEHEAAARQRKVESLTATLDKQFEGHMRLALASVRAWDTGNWADLAIEAGVRPPSPATVAATVAALEFRIRSTSPDRFDPAAVAEGNRLLEDM